METLSSEAFMPHGHCYLWKPWLIWIHVISDAIIVISYFSIPLILTYIVYKTKSKIPFNAFMLLFAIFILACGTTHLLEIVNVWQTKYILSAIVKLVTAIASIGTTIALIPIISKVIISLQNDRKL